MGRKKQSFATGASVEALGRSNPAMAPGPTTIFAQLLGNVLEISENHDGLGINRVSCAIPNNLGTGTALDFSALVPACHQVLFPASPAMTEGVHEGTPVRIIIAVQFMKLTEEETRAADQPADQLAA
jgi:hypothetical protein